MARGLHDQASPREPRRLKPKQVLEEAARTIAELKGEVKGRALRRAAYAINDLIEADREYDLANQNPEDKVRIAAASKRRDLAMKVFEE